MPPKKVLLFFVLLLTAAILFADFIEIGTGTTTAPEQGPFYNYYKNNRTQTLYLSSELPGASIINMLSFNLSRISDSQYMQLPNFSIKILPTADAQLAAGAFYDMTNATHVFFSSSYLLASSIGWTDIEIENYLYNGSDNLIIEISWGQLADYASFSTYCQNFKTASTGVTRMLYGYSDILNPPTYNSSAQAYSNIRFHYYPQEGYPQQPYNPYPENNAINVATSPSLVWNFGDDTETFDLYFGLQNPPTNMVINNQIAEETGFYQPDELEHITTYYWRVIARNSNRHEVAGPVWSFTTAYPPGVVAVTVGNGTILEERIPLCFYYKNSITQTIYTADELSTYGLITNIQYHNNFSSNLYSKPTKIWFGETTLTNLTDGWIPASQMTLVFEGNVDYPSGENTIDIQLTSPYLYENNHLVVMVQRPWDNTNYSQNDKFYITENTSMPNKTRYNRDNNEAYDPYNLPEPSYAFAKFPNTTFYFMIGGLGAVEGYVFNEDNQPVSQVEIRCESTQQLAFTNQVGFYQLGSLPPGPHTFTASKFGYESVSHTIEIEEDITAALDFVLPALGVGSVYGSVVGSDFPTSGLPNAAITLSGMQTHYGTTDENGEFSISDVFFNQEYTITISHEFYSLYQDNIMIINSDLGEFVLNEITMPPGNIFANQNEAQTQLQLNWNSPGQGGTEFRYDDGEPIFQIGFGNLPNAVFGAIHRNIAIVQEISWFLTSNYGNHPHVKLFLFGLTESGHPDQSQLLYQSQQIANIDNEWNSYELPSSITCPNGFLVGINTPNVYTSIALDDGLGEPWIFQDNTHYGINDWTNSSGAWIDIGSENIFRKNMLLRAYGINMGDLSGRGTVSKSTERAFESYNVYRFFSSQQETPQFWQLIASAITDTTFTDSNWGSVAGGEYQFAVTSVHTNNVESMPAFSNTIWKTSVHSEENVLPLQNILGKNYPNPFNPTTTITFAIGKEQHVKLEVYNIKGEKVITLVDMQLSKGWHDTSWNGKDQNGNIAASGIYFYKLKTTDFEKVEKMILLK